MNPQAQPTDAALEDFAATLSAIPDSLIELATADPGGSQITRATYHKGVTLNELIRVAKRDQSAFFLTGIKPQAPVTLGVETKRITTDQMVTARNIITVDFDFKTGLKDEFISKVAVTAPVEERLEIAKELAERYLPRLKKTLGGPWLIVFSGNGLHIHYRLKKPLEWSSKEEYSIGYKGLIDALENTVFDCGIELDRACSNTARIFRLPGSVNWKNKTAPALTEILYHSPEADSSEAFKKLWATSNQVAEKMREAALSPERKAAPNQHLEELRASLTFEKTLQHFGYQKWDSLKRLSNGEIICSSPWRTDSNPSCFLNEGKKVYRDHGSTNGGDIFDFIADMANLDSKQDFPKVIAEAERITGISPLKPVPRLKVVKEKAAQEQFKERLKRATYNDYADFFRAQMPQTKRDIFSGELKIWMGSDGWQPAASRLGILGSHAMDTGFLKRNALKDHFDRFEDGHKKELLVDIPEWDGVDRLQQIAGCVHAKNASQTQFEELMKEWGATMFRRVFDPSIQNRIVVLKGGQGIGKDTLVDSLLDGLGALITNMTISRNEADNFSMLADHLVINISEFDRASQVEAGTLKAWITQKDATFRRPYEKSHKRYDLRCSFIATCNVDEILRDHTGGRRFIIFDLEKIDWSYPKTESLQILAQWKHLADIDYQASPETNKAMSDYIEGQTPPDPTELLLEDYDERMREWERKSPEAARTANGALVSEILAAIAHRHSVRLHKLQAILNSKGRSKKTSKGRVYFPGPYSVAQG